METTHLEKSKNDVKRMAISFFWRRELEKKNWRRKFLGEEKEIKYTI